MSLRSAPWCSSFCLVATVSLLHTAACTKSQARAKRSYTYEDASAVLAGSPDADQFANSPAQSLMQTFTDPSQNAPYQQFMNNQQQPFMSNQAQSLMNNAPQPLMNSQMQMRNQMQPTQQLANLQESQSNLAQQQLANLQESQSNFAQGQSFLGVSSQAATAALVSRLSDAVEAQSKALTVLEAEQEQLARREAAFEAEAVSMMRTGKCKDYSKNNVGKIDSTSTCKSGCETGEGITGCNRFSGTAGTTAKCECSRSGSNGNCNSWTTICNDLSVGVKGSMWVVLCALVAMMREFE